MKILTIRYLLFFLLTIYSLNDIVVNCQIFKLTLNPSLYNQSKLKLETEDEDNFYYSFQKMKQINESKVFMYNNNLKNFPFRFTTEFAGGNFMEDDKLKLGFITSLEINLYDRIWFLKLEYGQFYNISYEEEGIHFGALGINYRFFKIKKNSFSVHGALFALGNKHNGVLVFIYHLGTFIL